MTKNTLLILIAFMYIAVLTKANASEWQNTPVSKVSYVEMDDKIKLEVVDWGGKGTPLIFLAGLSLNAHTFDHFAPRFTHSYRVIGVTRVGHGSSESRTEDFSTARLVKDIINVMDDMNIDNAVFVGHSFAGGELNHLGKYFPQRVKGLIYIDALQALEYMDSHLAVCPDLGYANIEMFIHKEHFYHTQRLQNSDGRYIPFADLIAIEKLINVEIKQGRDYSGISAPAIAINHIPEQTKDFFRGVGSPSQLCMEEINKMTYLGVARFIKDKKNADVAAIQNSQHMIYMATPDKLLMIMNNWLSRMFVTNKK